MDALDFAILGELFAHPRAAYQEIGHRVGLSANAVKARLSRLEEDGVLRGFHAAPRSDLLGLRDGLLVFHGVDDLEDREEEILRNLPDVPGVLCADAGLDRSVLVWIAYRDEEDWERLERAAVSLVGKPPSEGIRDERGAEPAPLAPADWRLLHALVGDGRAALHQITARSGLSPKTARKRLEALTRAGHVRIEPVVSPAEARGLVLFTLLLHVDDAVPDAVLRAHLPPGSIITRPGPAHLRVVQAQATSLREAHQAVLRARAAPGVARASLHLPARRAGGSWLADLSLARLEAARFAPAPAAPRLPPPVPMTPQNRG